jgi:hypothetical protein
LYCPLVIEDLYYSATSHAQCSAVPQDGDYIDVQPLAKGKTEKQKKKKERK